MQWFDEVDDQDASDEDLDETLGAEHKFWCIKCNKEVLCFCNDVESEHKVCDICELLNE